MRMRRTARAVGVLFVLAIAMLEARAEFPLRTVRIVVPYMPGGMADLQARALAEELGRKWTRGVVVENRPGAGGTLGAAVVARATDGHTLYIAGPAHAITATLMPDLPYDPMASFEPVAGVGVSPFVLIVPGQSSVRSMSELVALAAKRPGGLTYATAGVGTAPNLIGTLLAQRSGIELRHVPYKGAPEAVNAAVAGDTDFAISDASAFPHVRTGRVRALAVSGNARAASLPEVPTMKEAGLPGCEILYRSGILAPAGTPPAVVETIAAAIREALESPRLKARFAAMGLDIVHISPAEYRAALARDIGEYGQRIREAGLLPGG